MASERVTVVETSEEQVPGLGTVLVLTLTPEDGSDRPSSLGPRGLANLEAAVTAAAGRGRELAAVVLTGRGRTFLAGADLGLIRAATAREDVLALARAGHRVVSAIADLPVPTLAHLNGNALGGGVEMALACDYRTAAAGVRAVALPETHLGLLPGWGGCTLLPRLIGPEAALTVIIDNPARNNRRLDANQAADLGLLDQVLPADAGLDAALAWLARTVAGEIDPVRREAAGDAEWQEALGRRRAAVGRAAAGGAPAPSRALEVIAAARDLDRAEAFALEDEALADLVLTDQTKATLYALDELARQGKSPTGMPDAEAREIRSVGVAGAGLMAGQLALLLARSLRVPVTMRDLDTDRAERGLAAVHEQVDADAARGRLTPGQADQLKGLLSATTDLDALAGADLVIEAVFEELDVKKKVFAELEDVVGQETILATNTSALSVTAMADGLRHPERVVGLHFFNPVAQMPLVEVVRAARTDDVSYATAFSVAAAARKTAVAVADAPGFVVNRVLVRLLGEVLGALEEGTPVVDAERALAPMGLPMGPFQLLQLVGPAVARHVLLTLRSELGERYPDSPGLARVVAENRSFLAGGGRPSATSEVDGSVGEVFRSRPLPEPLDGAGLLDRVRRALAEEVSLLLEEGVVAGPGVVDVAMILGAGWPLHNGGITPYLDRTGAAEAVTGSRFNPAGVADLAR